MKTRHPQHALWAKCFHPSGSFSEFSKEEVETSVPARFEKIVGRFPDRLAIKTENELLTYAELNARANRVARAIIARQGSEAAPVALLLEKGPSLVAATIAVLKAGKFFVTLDPSLPRARITTVLEDSQAALMVTDRQNLSLAEEAAIPECRLLDLQSVDCDISECDLELGISPRAIATIVYTSGSTGQPKGVVWDHRDLLHRIMLRTNETHACAEDRTVLLPAGTANAVTNIFFALLNGAGLFPFDVQKEGTSRLGSWLLKERISICPISSPLFRKLCEALTGEERFPDLRVIRLRSETVYASDVELYRKYFSSNCLFVTGLSTSESGQLTSYFIDHETRLTGSEVPVGYAVEDKEILLLDNDGKQVGFNAVAEIAVRSRHLSPDYWRRPELSKAKFRPGPQGGENRLCLTGDLGLMLPDGCLIHKGRKDFRVKIRGYGVETAEVEKVLRDHPGIKEAAVVARESGSDETRLIAYFTPLSEAAPSVTELRRFLKEKLPDYMIPAGFVPLGSMPLTMNGKVDRQALPEPKTSRPDLQTPFLAPATPKQERLARIWAEALGLDQVGAHDNFFDLGGHSLSAMQILSRIREEFRIEIVLRDFLENPTVVALATCLESSLAPQDGRETLPLQSTPRDGQLPLSFAQQRLWFLDQLEPGSAAYNLFSAVKLSGPLDAAALERSFNEIILRHEALRTVFQDVSGAPFQSVLAPVKINLTATDLRQHSASEQAHEIQHLMREEAHRPFDLARGPLLRATLLRTTENAYLLLLAIHHIAFDGWSRAILARELSALYAAFSRGEPLVLPPLPVQYADFARWQRKLLQGKMLDDQLAYWRKQLENLPTLRLPADRSRPPIRSARGARQYLALPKTLSTELKRLSNRHGVTLFMTLLAAYLALLRRYSGQDDIVIGSPISGRNHSALENLIGFFLNMLVLRIDLSGNPPFRELLGRVRNVCLGAYAHQDLPFERLVEELQLERNLSYNPLFQATFTLQNSPSSALELTGLTAEDVKVDTGIVRFDLHLLLAEHDEGLQGYIDYNTDLFDAATIIRMLGHFHTLLESIVADPDATISRLSILSEEEKHQLLRWNDTRKDYSKNTCIHQRFEAQVENTPDAVAIVSDDGRLTYRELNSRANQLAHYLRELGVGPEAVVGICMERSLEMVVAIFGVLKAGGAYVPLDPAYPKERLSFMLEDSRSLLLLTQQRLFERLPGGKAWVIFVDAGWEAVATRNQENPVSSTRPGNLAYAIYTSGSTGRPKGVMISHRAIDNHMLWMQDEFPLTKEDRVVQKTPFGFDASVWEFLAPLLAGAQLVMAEPRGHQDSSYLVKLIAEKKVTVLQLVPSLLRLFLEEKELKSCESLKRVFCGGEPLPVELVERFLDRLPVELHNLYGPTEASIDAAFWTCARDRNQRTIPIGRPIANAETYLLDSHLNPVPIGVTGEIHIGGIGLARGYLNHADLTAENFIPNPFTSEPGARLYRTGDLGRYLPDGNIEFVGRMDHQVKIRGFRIELGEVEALLRQHESVQDSIVLLRQDSPDDSDLVAYVVSTHEPATTTKELRAFLKRQLPEYMVPSAFVFLDSLPLTPNGKVDRRALPKPGQERPDLKQTYVAPRTLVEKRLADIWKDVLKLEQVGTNHNFFELGGHSLKATQVMSRVHALFETDIPLRTLFEKPTVQELAAVITERQAKPPAEKEVSTILTELESLSDDDAQDLVSKDSDSLS
jgi:amino acid adenylation domain-containing protein